MITLRYGITVDPQDQKQHLANLKCINHRMKLELVI